MKEKMLLVVFVVICFVTAAQDIIYQKDGTEIRAKVLEIDENVVKYKNFDHQDGPTRSIQLKQVFLIIYENGKRENFESKNKEEMQVDTETATKGKTQEVIKSGLEEEPQETNTVTKNYLDLKIQQAKTGIGVGKGMFYGGWVGIAAGLLTSISSSSSGTAGIITMAVSGVVMNVGWIVWLASAQAKKGYEKRRYELSVFFAPSKIDYPISNRMKLPAVGVRVNF